MNKKTRKDELMHPLITVVTATYNLIKAKREEYIRKNIETVHNQTYKNIEHIIIDGASDDGTLEIFKSYPWLKVFSEPDNGIYYAMNKGIEKANGKYITFLNSDDFYHNKKGIEKAVELLEKYNADYCFSDHRSQNGSDDKNFTTRYSAIENLPFGVQYNHQTMITRTDIMKELGGFDTSYKMSADGDFEIRLCRLNKKFIKVPVSYATYRGGGFSSQNAELVKNEHARSFYLNIGKDCGLTEEDCRNMWGFHGYDKKLYEKYVKTGLDDTLLKLNAKKENKFEKYFKRYKECTFRYYSFQDKIFSIKNSLGRRYKVIAFLGIPFIFKKK